MKTSNRNIVMGFAWYDRTQWQRLTEVVPDRSELDDTFEQWEKNALKAMRALKRRGQRVERVQVEIEALMLWCKAQGLPINGSSRAQYVSAVLQQRDRSTEA